jgi:hypothetical protein
MDKDLSPQFKESLLNEIETWKPLIKTIIKRIVSRCPELKTEANALMRESKEQVSVSPNDVTLELLKWWKRLSLALRGQPISKETAIESAIKLEMKLLSNPELYPPQSDTKPKDHLVAWLYLNPKIRIKILGRKIKLTAPHSQSDKINSVKQASIEEIDLYGFSFVTDRKPKNVDLNEYKSAIIGELADAASKALKIPISDNLVKNLF